MNRVIFCLLSAASLVHASTTETTAFDTTSATESATEIIEPLEEYLDEMEIGSPLTAQVYVITSQGGQTWNNSITYCEETFAGIVNADCYLAELLTEQQIKALGTELIGNNWDLWVGAYWKPQSNGKNRWVWYHTGLEIDAPNIWQFGYPLALNNGGNYAATANSYLTWGSLLQNNQLPTSENYFACTCY